MGGTFSTLRRIQSTAEQKFAPPDRDDTGKYQQEDAATATPENITTSREASVAPSQENNVAGTSKESDINERESTIGGSLKGSLKREPTETSPKVKGNIGGQYDLAETIDEAPSPPMPRDSDEIKLDETTGSPNSKLRTIYVSGDDREPELEFNEVEFEHVTSNKSARDPQSDTSVMVVGDPVIRHPFPSTPDNEELNEDESVTVVVNVESRHNGKRRRSTHSFTSQGGEPSSEIVKYLTNDEFVDAEEGDASISTDTNKEEDLVEVKVDFYRRKRRRNCSAPCGYPALQDSLARVHR